MFYIRKLYSTEVLVTLNLPSISLLLPPSLRGTTRNRIYLLQIHKFAYKYRIQQEIAATNAYTNTNTVGKQCVNATGKQSITITNREGKSKQEIGKRELGKTLRKLKAQAEAEAEAAAESAVAQAESALASSRAQSVCAREFATSRGTHTHTHTQRYSFSAHRQSNMKIYSAAATASSTPLCLCCFLCLHEGCKNCVRARVAEFVFVCVRECSCVRTCTCVCVSTRDEGVISG